MSLSSFCVVTNALRLNLFRMYDSSRDRKIRHKKRKNTDIKNKNNGSADAENKSSGSSRSKEDKTMTKTMKIEGMMCGHCEARVKKALEALPEVSAAEVSHEAGTAVVTLEDGVSDEVLKKTVEDQDYKVLGIE